MPRESWHPTWERLFFVGGVTLGLLITDEAAAPIRGTNDVDVIAEIITYADYIAFSERLRDANFTEDAGEQALTCRWPLSQRCVDLLNTSTASLLRRGMEAGPFEAVTKL
jgi:hypothetical protein